MRTLTCNTAVEKERIMQEMIRSTVGWPAGARILPRPEEWKETGFRVEKDSIGEKQVPEDFVQSLLWIPSREEQALL